ncbi:MAG: glycoside hydrolase family 31 protein [Eubacteriales bacterium]|nr:glycoside hydrolase family 31 protein [Eubacteriales bacterium]
MEKKTQIRIAAKNGFLTLIGISDRIVRCVFSKKESLHPESPLDLFREEKPVLEQLGDRRIQTEHLLIEVSEDGERICWKKRKTGEVLLTEGNKELSEIPVMVYSTGQEEPKIRRVKTVDGDRNFVENLRPEEVGRAYRAKMFFRWKPEEQIHGLGQGEEGIYNYRGHVQYLYQHNMRIPCPWILSDRGYGILYDCGSLMTFNDDERGSYLFLDTVEQLDYYFIAGDSVDEIIRGFRHLTGKAVMLPKWAFGYVQSKERYVDQKELVSVARKYRELGVGLDCVVQDWKTWKDDDWGYKCVDKERFPNLAEMSEELHNMHVHSMVSVWPNMNFDTGDCQEMIQHGFLLHDLATYDAFVPEARALYWKQADRELFSGGFDSWWCDSTEPFSGPDWGGEYKREPWERFRLVGEEHKKFLGAKRANLYAVAHAKGMYENQRKTTEEKRVLNLTRSGYPGIQRYGTMLWSGDTAATWKNLRIQLTEGLNMSLSGMPYWTLDIGGFFTLHENWQKRGCGCHTDPTPKWFWIGDFEDGAADPGYRELYVRWLQMGMFLPMFRSHGTDTPREIWNFGNPGERFYEAIKETIALRYRLMPYIYSLAGQVWLHDGTMQRSLLFDFPEDENAAGSDEAFLLGKAFLVYPVTEPMLYGPKGEKLQKENVWKCYLPKGTDWYDFFTGQKYAGGQTVLVDVSNLKMPVFVRSGSVVPMEQGLTYADEKVTTPMEFHIYPGEDGEFLYYEDDGDGYAYEQGKYHEIPLTWNEKEQTLTIGGVSEKIASGLIGRHCAAVLGEQKIEFIYQGSDTVIRF